MFLDYSKRTKGILAEFKKKTN